MTASVLNDPTAHRLVSHDLEALFIPARGMLGASLKHRGEELLRRVEDLDAAAAKGSTAGIPLLHPWANRLAASRFNVIGRPVDIDPDSPLVHLDEHRLPIHGVPWTQLHWRVVKSSSTSLYAGLDWTDAALLRLFPFRHRLEMLATLANGGLTITATMHASAGDPVPVCFGFHPYVGLPGVPREHWHVSFPAMTRLLRDDQHIPTGQSEPFTALEGPLGQRAFDDGFTLPGDRAMFTISGGGRRIGIEFIEGFPCAQVYAPAGRDLVAIEPMTAPTNALVSGEGLRILQPGQSFRATFRINVADTKT